MESALEARSPDSSICHRRSRALPRTLISVARGHADERALAHFNSVLAPSNDSIDSL